MDLQISEETTAELRRLGEDLLLLLNSIVNFILQAVNEFFEWSAKTISGLSVYSVHNIKEQGLKEILYQRALRFFKLENTPQKRKHKEKYIRKEKSVHFKFSKSIIRLMLLPIYLLVVVLLWKKRKTNTKKSKN